MALLVNMIYYVDNSYAKSHEKFTHPSPHVRPNTDSEIRKIFACGIRENFACAIRNPGLWNPEYSSRNPESY